MIWLRKIGRFVDIDIGDGGGGDGGRAVEKRHSPPAGVLTVHGGNFGEICFFFCFFVLNNNDQLAAGSNKQINVNVFFPFQHSRQRIIIGKYVSCFLLLASSFFPNKF